MFKISRDLNEMKYNGDSIKLAIMGAGKMGTSLISQLSNMDAMEVKLVFVLMTIMKAMKF